MSEAVYTYDPAKLTESGKDRMRFELGDVMTDGGPETAYFSDEEIEAMLQVYPRWKRAKLELVKSVLHRFAYETDTKVGAMQLWLDQRYAHFKALYEELKNEAEAASTVPGDSAMKKKGPPYFFEGMHNNLRTEGSVRGREACTLDRNH